MRPQLDPEVRYTAPAEIAGEIACPLIEIALETVEVKLSSHLHLADKLVVTYRPVFSD